MPRAVSLRNLLRVSILTHVGLLDLTLLCQTLKTPRGGSIVGARNLINDSPTTLRQNPPMCALLVLKAELRSLLGGLRALISGVIPIRTANCSQYCKSSS